MAEVAVITDTVSYIPEETLSQYRIIQVPAHVIIGDKVYPENEMDLADLYQQIPKWREANTLPTTSSPSPEEFVQAYRELSRDYQSIVYVGYSTKLGMAVQSALLARDLVKDELPQTEIEVLDANTACGAQMLITLEAARAAHAGGSFKEVTALAREMISKVNFLYLSDDLYHLAKGGRIHRARP